MKDIAPEIRDTEQDRITPAIAQNPNPRANENIESTTSDARNEEQHRTEGTGTEITDGEAG